MKTKSALIALACLAALPAWAVNKCTMADGKVVFQDAPCDTKAKREETVRSAPAVTGITKAGWIFERGADAMTGQVSCVALSPATYIAGRTHRDLTAVRVLVMAQQGGRFLAMVRIDGRRDGLFHNDLSGMGLKTDPGEFHDISVKVGQQLVGFTNSATVIDSMLLAKSMRLRLRFWPYDSLVDSPPISTAGITQAVAQAAECAKQA